MRLKTLEVSGFKSFVDRTVIEFEAGITGIVGPNGCGKSNIVDAIRWVMGEMSAKHLRGSAMEDVIFNGCETRPPIGMSQVFLTFDNSDGRAPADYASYSEIQVGRRLYRSGESEYFINKTPCRLKDIVDLFLGTGVGTKAYSIVEQGMVGAIVSSRPEDRRMLIEEAAGISKFKARKEAALRKMDATKQNLARLGDIHAELTRHINSLHRQAKKAERFQRVSEELKEHELALASTRYLAMGEELSNLESNHGKFKEVETSSSAELSTFETKIETKRLELTTLERELDGIQQNLYITQNTIKLSESEIGHKTKEQTNIVQQNEALAAELGKLKERKKEIQSQIESANSAMALADLRLQDSTNATGALETEANSARVQFIKTQTKCDGLKNSMMEATSSISNLNAALEHLERRRIDITGRIAKDQSEIDAIDRRAADIQDKLSENRQVLEGARQLKLKISEEFESATATLEMQRLALSEAESTLAKTRDCVSEKRSKLNSLKELRKNLEGYKDGVRAVLSRTDESGEKFSGILGTVSEFIETEPEYEPALGAVLGEKLQYVVVRSHEEGVGAIDYLRTAACGRSTFIPLGARSAASESTVPGGEGVAGPIMNFVRFSDEHKNICEHLLKDVVLVDDLKRALSLWEEGGKGKTFVTRDGCVVDPAGAVTGGSASGVEEQLIAQKRRIKELEEELSGLTGELTTAQGMALKLAGHVKAIEEQIDTLRRDAHGKDLHVLGQERDLERLGDELKRYEVERDRLTVETAALSEELNDLDRETSETKQNLSSFVAKRLESETALAEVQAEMESLAGDKDSKEKELIDLKVSLAKANERASSVERELVSLLKLKIETVLSIDKRSSEITFANFHSKTLEREIEMLKEDLNLAIRSVTRLQDSQNIIKQRYESESAALSAQELSIRDLRRQHDEALTGFHEVELKLAEHRARMMYLADGIRERYHLDLAAMAKEHARQDLDIETEESLVAELKERIEGIGSVNVDAIKEYEELSERHEFLTRQIGDLNASMENLSKAIAKINRTSRQKFKDAFESVDGQFQKLFPKLFRGGQARLMLTDEENLLETGIEIIAQPPGKKLQSITLLSGGEKALTAVALIFSIFLIKPSPFCLLDEVDAPLDDANIDRFNDLIRSMVPHSQFILITHNKRTMELADLLYGVTMEEAGVSKMVSVRLGVEKSPEQAVA